MPKDASADEALARMGYQSELPRNLSMLSILGLYVSFYCFLFLLWLARWADLLTVWLLCH